MGNCKTCKTSCKHIGEDNVKECKKYSPVRTCVIKTNELESFPERVVVHSKVSGDERIFVKVEYN